MTPERWQQIKAVLAEAMEVPSGERVAFVDRVTGHDTDLGREVRSLLAVAQAGSDDSITSRFVPSTDRALQAILATALGQQYEVVRPLGQGGMGAVYLARERALERFVAIKVLRPDLADTETSRERFRREARVAAQLSHPNILPLHTFGEVSGIWYFVMGYVRGVTLAERLRVEGRLPSEEAQRILVELAGALEHAHAHGVIHRDIKPANVLLDEQTGRAMLADFGISKVHGASDSLTGSGVIIGTPDFMSPEQSLGAPVDERSDIYSLGAVAYTMLAGRTPFADSKPNEMVFRRLAEDAPVVSTVTPSVDPDLAAIVMRCLAREPSRRWQTARDLRQALVRVTGDALATIPESLRDLPSFGPYALIWVTVWMAIAFAGDRSLDDIVLLALVAIAVPFGFLVHIWNVGRPDLGWAGIGRVAFWPPDWWGMWWPRALRRPTDLWKRLPWPARAVRTSLSVFMIALPAMILLRPQLMDITANAPLPWYGDVQAALVIGAAATIVAGLVWAYRRKLSWSDTARLLVGATTPSSGWSSASIAPLLAPVSGRTRGPTRDTPAEHRRAIIDALPTLPGAAIGVVPEVTAVVKRLHDEIDVHDREIAALERDASPAEVERLSARLAALNSESSATPARRELVDLVRRELDVVRELRVAAEVVSKRRAHLYAMLRGIWTQVCIVRDQAAPTSSPAHPMILRLLELCNDASAELNGEAAPINSQLSQARAVAHSRLSAGVILLALLGSACSHREGATAATDAILTIDSLWATPALEIKPITLLRGNAKRVVFTEMNGRALLTYPLSGGPMARFGQRGQGPGDFASIADFAQRGDSVFVLDGMLRRVQKFIVTDSSVRLADVWPIPSGFGDTKRIFVRGDGSIVLAFVRRAPPKAVPDMTVLRDSVVVVVMQRDSTGQGQVVRSFPGTEYAYLIVGGGLRSLATPAFSSGAFFDLSDAGVAIGDGRTGAITVQPWNGSMRVLAAADTVRLLVSAEEIEQLRARADSASARLASLQPSRAAIDREVVDASFQIWNGPPPRPFFERALTDGKIVALQEYAFGDPSEVRWRLVDTETIATRRLSVPGHVRIVQVMGDTALGIARDSLGVESIRLFRIRGAARR